MFWYELPHPDTVQIAFEQMNSRVRWLLTFFIFLLIGLCWYFFVYSSVTLLITSYREEIVDARNQYRALPARRQVWQHLEHELMGFSRKLQAVEVAIADCKQPCIWMSSLMQSFDVALLDCSCDVREKQRYMSCTLQGTLSQLNQACGRMHGLHSGWLINSLSLQPLHRQEHQEQNVQGSTDGGIYTAYIRLVQVNLVPEGQQGLDNTNQDDRIA